LLPTRLLVADGPHDRVEIHHRIHPAQGASPPPPDLVGDAADRVGRHVDAVALGELIADVAHGHARRIHAQHPAGQALQAGLARAHQLEREGGVAIPRDGHIHPPVLGMHRLGGRGVASSPELSPLGSLCS